MDRKICMVSKKYGRRTPCWLGCTAFCRRFGWTNKEGAGSDPLWQHVRALIANESAANGVTAFRDMSLVNATVTRGGNAVWSNAQAPAGQTTSVALDGAGDYLQLPTGANYRYAGDFCVEGWFYHSGAWGAIGVNEILFDCRTTVAGTNGFAIYTGGANIVAGQLAVYSNSGDIINMNDGSAPLLLPNNQWNHVALDRSGTSLKLWVNGVQTGSTATNSTNFSEGACSWGIDATNQILSPWIGYIASCRITAASRYQAAFTPPALPLFSP